MGKDTVVIRSDVNPSLNDSPFLKYPDQVRDYFKQYGHCDAIYNAHTSRGGLVTYTVVLLFRESAAANRVKQKYNGRVLKGARVTTSWLDIRQYRELGMPDSLKHQMNQMSTTFVKEKQAGRGRLGFQRGKGRGRGRGRGRSPVVSSDQEFSYSSRSQSGTDSESLDGFSFSSKQYRPSTPSGQGSSFKFLDAPKEGRRERLESSERPSSRTSSHSQSSWTEGDRDGSRKRKESSPPGKGKAEDTDGGEKGSEKKKGVSQMLYVPRSKRKMEDGGEAPGADSKNLKSVFDRLGPTKDQEKDLYQLEAYGDVATKKSKPNDSSILSPKTPTREGSPKSVSETPEKESAGGVADDGKKENSARGSEKDDKKSRSSRHGSEHESSRHKKSRKKSASDKDRPKLKERSSDREKPKGEHGDSVKQTTRRDARTSTPTTPSDIFAAIEDPGTPPLPPGHSLPLAFDPQWLEYYRQAGNEGQLAQGHLGPNLTGPEVGSEQVASQRTAALANKQSSSSASSRLSQKRIDKETALAVLKEFDSQALLLATSTKLLLSNSPCGHMELQHSMEAAIWQLANRLLSELK